MLEINVSNEESVVFLVTDDSENPPPMDLARLVLVHGVEKSAQFPRSAARAAVDALQLDGSTHYVWKVIDGEPARDIACCCYPNHSALWKWRDGEWRRQK